MHRVMLAFVVLALLGGAAPVVPTPPSSAPPANVVRWVRESAVPVGSLNAPPSPAEAAALDRALAGARVIGLGENNHGNAEPLRYRNRLIGHLAGQGKLAAVALESGLAESRQLYDYVLGGPGEARALVRTGLTHAFGELATNLELVEWLRAHNAAHPEQVVRLYGIDRSTIQSWPPGARGVVLAHVIDYLAATLPGPSTAVRAELARFAGRFTETDYPTYSASDRAALDTALAAAEALFREHRAAMIDATSAERYDWAAREALDAARLPGLFRSWVIDGSDIPKLIHVLELRDAAMADHTGWVLRREGARGAVLLFQANGHVAADQMVGSVMRSFPRQPKLTGVLLRERLGAGYRAIATVSSRGKGPDDPGSGGLDRALAAAGRAPMFLDLRRPERPRWFTATQSASQGDARLDDFAPARAFDALVYFDRLTPLPPPKP